MKDYKKRVGHEPDRYCAFDNETQQNCIKANMG